MVHEELDLRPRVERAGHDLATMHDQPIDGLVRVFDFKARTLDLDDATIAHLAALLRIERRRARNDLALRTIAELVDGATVCDQREDFALRALRVVPKKLHRSDVLGQLRIHLGYRATADFGALTAHASLLELFIEPLVIDFEALLLPDDFLEPQRKPVRVIEAKRDLARERTGAVLLDPFVIVRDELQAAIHGAAETLLLLIGDLLDQGAALVELRVDVAHVVGDLKSAVMQERLADSESVPMANRTPHHPAKDIRPAIFVGEHPLGNQECRGPGVVGDDSHAHVILGLARLVALARNLGRQVDHRPQEVGVVVAQDALFDDSNPLEPRTCIDRRGRQGLHLAAFMTLELHEHEIPELEPTAPVGSRLIAERARVDVVDAEGVVNLGTRAARTGVAHLPEVVFGAAADDALVRKACDVLPDRRCFVVGGRKTILPTKDGDDEPLRVELERVG